MHRSYQSMRVGLPKIAIVLFAFICTRAGAQAPTPPGMPAGAMPVPVAQANGDVITMPQNLPVSRRTGLILFVDTRWVNAYGYRPVEVTISSPLPTTATHTVTIQLHSGWDNVTTVEQEFEFPLGAKRASTIVSVPFYDQSTFGVWWDARVDGVKDIDLSMNKMSAARRANGTIVSTSAVRVLVPSSQATPKSLVSTSVFDFEVLSLALADFPRRWIDYTCLDVVSISMADLEQLSKTNPAALESMERWVRTGGQLWVSDIGAKLEKLPELSKQLNVPESQIKALADPIVKDSNAKTNEKTDVAAEQPSDRPAEVGWRPSRFRGGGPAGQAQGFSDRRTGRNRGVNDPRVIAQVEGARYCGGQKSRGESRAKEAQPSIRRQ